MEEVNTICPADVRLLHVRQGEAKGLGQAISCARPAVGSALFALVLPDRLIVDFESDLSIDNSAAMVKRFNESGASQVLVEPVQMERVSNYGLLDTNGCEISSGNSADIKAIVEKPPADNEFQLPDTIGMLMEGESV